MSLAPGTRLGPHQIVAPLGAGGMGEVYRATDTNLDRDVAVKVLPESFALDADRVARFTREARTLAALNHPNIGAIYGLEKTADLTALVMELVEGEDLSAHIARGPIALPDALPIAKQIAEALEAAHEQGIIHRDLKPQNIKIKGDIAGGTVKVLDFGLAKAMDPTGAPADPVHSPTLTVRGTQMGMIVGTAAYMAPEQAKGRPVDKRADIWAFGVVVCEMLTGRPLFEAEDVSETLTAVLTRNVNAMSLPVNIPPRLRALIRDCLIRDPKQRLRDIGEARRVLEQIMASAPEEDPAAAAASTTVASAPARTRERVAWGAAATFALLAAGAGAWAFRPVAPPRETRLEIATPGADDLFSFAISPDGRSLVFVAPAASGQPQLWLRPLDETTPQALAGTEGASFPFWSPDSRSVAFLAGNQLKRLDLGGGLPKLITGAPSGSRGGSWGADGVIMFASTSGPLLRVPATGGVRADVTTLAPGQASHRFPHFLPGGRQFLCYGGGELYLGSLDSPEVKPIATAETNAQFVLPNWLLFVRQGTLVAQRLDLTRGELTGEPELIADRVSFDATLSVGAFSASPAGPITYRTGTSTETQLTWFDRTGKVAGTIGEPDANGLLQPTLSPDGRRVAAYRTFQNNLDVWVFDDAARMIRFTFDAGRETYPLWSPDGSRITFSKDDKAGVLSLYQKSSTGGGQEELFLPATRSTVTPQSWTRDGRFLLLLERNPETAADLLVLPMDGTQKPSVFVNSKFEERMGQFSPARRWVAYSSDESGVHEVYVRPFRASSGQWKASVRGGVTPRWRQDGKELYYIAPDGTLMAVPFAAAGRAPEMGAPKALFHPRILNGGASVVGVTWQYDVAPDGRFLINVIVGDAVAAPITLLQNWNPGAKR